MKKPRFYRKTTSVIIICILQSNISNSNYISWIIDDESEPFTGVLLREHFPITVTLHRTLVERKKSVTEPWFEITDWDFGQRHSRC